MARAHPGSGHPRAARHRDHRAAAEWRRRHGLHHDADRFSRGRLVARGAIAAASPGLAVDRGAGTVATQFPAFILGEALQNVAPHATAWLYWYGYDREDTWAWVPSVGLLFTQIPLRFPDGKLPSRGWRWFSWYTVGALAICCAAFATVSVEVAPGVPNPVHIPGIESQDWLGVVVFGGLLAPSFIGSIASLFVRYRRANGLQRTQLRWVLWVLGLVVSVLILSWAVPEDVRLLQEFVQQSAYLSYVLVPLAILVAVLRYRLYEIDRIISRTVSYALVSLVVVGVYLLVVTSVHWLLPELPAIGVAIATLAAAGLFLPVLRWVRRIVDRRFDRERYNAEKVVDAFGDRLRNGADPHTTPQDLTRAVEQTLQPSKVGLWIPGGTRE